MGTLIFAGVILLTSIAGYLFGTLVLRLPRPRFVVIAQSTLEWLGLAATFLIFNVLFGVVIGVLVRTVTPWFLSLYVMSDIVVVPVSLAQALAFFCWRRSLE